MGYTLNADYCARKNPHPAPKNRVGGSESKTYQFSIETTRLPKNPCPENDPTPTKTVSGVCYYGFRYYSPDLGRWLNRDPVEEQGGINLNVFVNNRPSFVVDLLGGRPLFDPGVADRHDRPRNNGRSKTTVVGAINHWLFGGGDDVSVDIESFDLEFDVMNDFEEEFSDKVLSVCQGSRLEQVDGIATDPPHQFSADGPFGGIGRIGFDLFGEISCDGPDNWIFSGYYMANKAQNRPEIRGDLFNFEPMGDPFDNTIEPGERTREREIINIIGDRIGTVPGVGEDFYFVIPGKVDIEAFGTCPSL